MELPAVVVIYFELGYWLLSRVDGKAVPSATLLCVTLSVLS